MSACKILCALRLDFLFSFFSLFVCHFSGIHLSFSGSFTLSVLLFTCPFRPVTSREPHFLAPPFIWTLFSSPDFISCCLLRSALFNFYLHFRCHFFILVKPDLEDFFFIFKFLFYKWKFLPFWSSSRNLYSQLKPESYFSWNLIKIQCNFSKQKIRKLNWHKYIVGQ